MFPRLHSHTEVCLASEFESIYKNKLPQAINIKLSQTFVGLENRLQTIAVPALTDPVPSDLPLI